MPSPCDTSNPGSAYWNLPEGHRAELIVGVLYDMTPPNRVHQQITIELSYALLNHVKQHSGPCKVYAAPFAVNLDADDTTWVEPDVLVVCDPSKLSDRGCEGAPDLVVEIVSPSSRTMDYLTKAELYHRAGVREYWIVDPAASQTTVYRYGSEGPDLRTYGFSQEAPVGIFDDELRIVVGDLL